MVGEAKKNKSSPNLDSNNQFRFPLFVAPTSVLFSIVPKKSDPP